MNTTLIEQQKTTAWIVDPNASSVEFAVKTFWGAMTVRGRFDRFHGAYELGGSGETIALTIDAESIDTGNATRDKHLRSDDFFHTKAHPQIRFTSTRVSHVTDALLHVSGDLEAAGERVPLEFAAQLWPVGDELEIEAETAVDQRRLGMSTGKLGMIRPPARLRVKARLAVSDADD